MAGVSDHSKSQVCNLYCASFMDVAPSWHRLESSHSNHIIGHINMLANSSFASHRKKKCKMAAMLSGHILPSIYRIAQQGQDSADLLRERPSL